jgi:hypothetical protein
MEFEKLNLWIWNVTFGQEKEESCSSLAHWLDGTRVKLVLQVSLIGTK